MLRHTQMHVCLRTFPLFAHGCFQHPWMKQRNLLEKKTPPQKNPTNGFNTDGFDNLRHKKKNAGFTCPRFPAFFPENHFKGHVVRIALSMTNIPSSARRFQASAPHELGSSFQTIDFFCATVQPPPPLAPKELPHANVLA